MKLWHFVMSQCKREEVGARKIVPNFPAWKLRDDSYLLNDTNKVVRGVFFTTRFIN